MTVEEALGVRYVKLHFTLEIMEDGQLPVSKASALRGGMGEMLLRANCIMNRKCEECSFIKECIVQRTMYSQFENKPEFITEGDSVGYVVECENYSEDFKAGDILNFNLILFGKTIVYFNQYLQAIYNLGRSGLGRNQIRFAVAQVTNTKGKAILDGQNVNMQNYVYETLLEYVEYRLSQVEKQGLERKMIFHTALTQKYQGAYLQEFDMTAITRSVLRRLYMLNAFEECDAEELYHKEWEAPELVSQEVRPIQVKRFSTRQGGKVLLKGIKGKIQFGEIEPELLKVYLAGEILHIGKNTSFGFGRYTIK